MLTDHDETLLHQAPLPIARPVTSDHRLYDRFFLTAVDPAGGASLAMSMGVYKNMNVIDGFAALAFEGRQYNVRVSRTLRPRFEVEACGLRYEVTDPFRALHISLQTDEIPLAFDLEWRGSIDPIEEKEWWGTHREINGRSAIDVRRYEQAGRANGWIRLGDRVIPVAQWFGVRDHSWGVRAGVGGYEPDNGGRLIDGRGMLLSWCMFQTDELMGVVARTEDDQGVQCGLDGMLRWHAAAKRDDLQVISATIGVDFPEGSRYYREANLDFATEDGRQWRLEIQPIAPAVICRGGGYDGGWNDGRGLGLRRGERYVEYDVYDGIDHPNTVRVSPGDALLTHNQREQIAHVSLNGARGMGDCTIIAFGALPRHGFGDLGVRW